MLKILFSRAAIFLATLCCAKTSLGSEPKFFLRTEKNKAFDDSSLVQTFNIKSENLAECLEHCLQDCRCQSFQICGNTRCQLCSSHKEENSLLLHEHDGCVYATYEMRQSFWKLDKQCPEMSCPMKYNCCQQAGLCPVNKVCKPVNSQEQPWKRFTCECQDGYHGENCDEPIRSCDDYYREDDGLSISGRYKVVDSNDSLYNVYCHFDPDGAWTLVQSYSFANSSVERFRKPLFHDLPVSENNPSWEGYRLSRPRMAFFQSSSTSLMFTCDYEKSFPITSTDYVKIKLSMLGTLNVLEQNVHTKPVSIEEGKIGEYNLSRCEFKFCQEADLSLHIVLADTSVAYTFSCADLGHHCVDDQRFRFFGSYFSAGECERRFHQCVQHETSTTQLWFGSRGSDTNTPPVPKDKTSAMHK